MLVSKQGADCERSRWASGQIIIGANLTARNQTQFCPSASQCKLAHPAKCWPDAALQLETKASGAAPDEAAYKRWPSGQPGFCGPPELAAGL